MALKIKKGGKGSEALLQARQKRRDRFSAVPVEPAMIPRSSPDASGEAVTRDDLTRDADTREIDTQDAPTRESAPPSDSTTIVKDDEVESLHTFHEPAHAAVVPVPQAEPDMFDLEPMSPGDDFGLEPISPSPVTLETGATRQDRVADMPPAPTDDFGIDIGARESDVPSIPEPLSEQPNQGIWKDVDTSVENASTSLGSGLILVFEGSLSNQKFFRVESKKAMLQFSVKKDSQKEVTIETVNGPVTVTARSDGVKVQVITEGGKTAIAKATEGVSSMGRFLSNLRYHVPETTLAVAGAVATATMLSVTWVKTVFASVGINPVFGAIVPGALMVGLAVWSYVSSKKDRVDSKIGEQVE